MRKLVLEPTITAQWHALVTEAESRTGQHLEEVLESYLVFLLQRFANKPELAESVLAMDYLQGHEAQGKHQQILLQEVGDKCLLFSGLFPEQAERKHVTVGYFISMGRSAYHFLADLSKKKASIGQLFEDLGEKFVPLMKLLHSIRVLGGEALKLSPLQAEELWRTTGSSAALQSLKQITDGFPVRHDDWVIV